MCVGCFAQHILLHCYQSLGCGRMRFMMDPDPLKWGERKGEPRRGPPEGCFSSYPSLIQSPHCT